MSSNIIPANQFDPNDLVPSGNINAPIKGATDRISPDEFEPGDLVATGKNYYESPEQFLKMAGENIAAGGTFGLSKVAEEKLLSNLEERKAREEAYPIASKVFQVGGAIGSIAATGGASGVMGLVRAGGAGAAELAALAGAGRFANAIGIAAEGALGGAISSAADDWSENKALDGEKLASHAGIGALLGVAIPGAMQLVGKAAGGVSSVIDKIKKALPEYSLGEGVPTNWANSVKAGISLAKTPTDEASMINSLNENIQTLYDKSREGARIMYEEIGKPITKEALQDIPTNQLKKSITDVIGNFKKAITEPENMVEGEIYKLSKTNQNILDREIKIFQKDFDAAQTSHEAYETALKFAKKLDRDRFFKFTKGPLPAEEQVEREVLLAAREKLRGGLQNPEVFGEAGNTFKEQSNLYYKYKNLKDQFESDWMSERTLRNGKEAYLMNPSKIRSYIKMEGDPRQAFKDTSLNNFMDASIDMARFGENQIGYNKIRDQFIDDLSHQIGKINNETDKLVMTNLLDKVKKGNNLSIQDVAILNVPFISTPLKIAASLLYKFKGIEGGLALGHDISTVNDMVQTAAKKIEETTLKTDKKIGSIFLGRD